LFLGAFTLLPNVGESLCLRARISQLVNCRIRFHGIDVGGFGEKLLCRRFNFGYFRNTVVGTPAKNCMQYCAHLAQIAKYLQQRKIPSIKSRQHDTTHDLYAGHFFQ
jgi:hypothetical protein